MHAVLGDETRLRIVDRLANGDASPGELGTSLAVPSNLLAHHVRALESVGLVERRRSEADRRRSYLHLQPGPLQLLLPDAVLAAPRIVFICTANSARSQLAAALWSESSDVPVASAGTHPAPEVAAGAVAAARRHGLDVVGSRPAALSDVVRDDDLVVTVCDHAHEELDGPTAAMPTTSRLHWSVPDPVRAGTDAAFDAAFLDLHDRVAQLAPRLTARLTAS